MDGGGGDVVIVGRAEIDTSAPIRSVKEAVVLFGERVLAGELDAGRRLTENRPAATRPIVNHPAVAGAPRRVPAVTPTELEEAKQKLEKEREEKQKMAGCIQSLQEELSNAMRELKKLKARDEEAAAKVIDLQVEDLKFVEIEKQQQSPPRSAAANNNDTVNAAAGEFQKKRYVTFADPPGAAYRAPPPAPLPDVVMELQQRAPAQPQYREVRFQRQMSVGHEAVKAAEEEGRKKKKKPLIPLVGALFMRKKKQSSCHDESGLKPRPTF